MTTTLEQAALAVAKAASKSTTAEAYPIHYECGRAVIQALIDGDMSKMLIEAGCMDGFDTDIEDSDIRHIEWFQAMLTAVIEEE